MKTRIVIELEVNESGIPFAEEEGLQGGVELIVGQVPRRSRR
ncbi:hypothetical protein [Archangium lansingense]|uniref:Uncharacterized protein n=1 Tax=Archangium lansingense TaxID=2995310 RepID=A0ABT4A123_9BACT|nr:hypothetical protein [Archangium lansinium]MCY1075328.1 hypothetical protein [Archangium lansinium]